MTTMVVAITTRATIRLTTVAPHLEDVCNARRMHPLPGYLSPKQFEDGLAQRAASFPAKLQSSLRGSVQKPRNVGQLPVGVESG